MNKGLTMNNDKLNKLLIEEIEAIKASADFAFDFANELKQERRAEKDVASRASLKFEISEAMIKYETFFNIYIRLQRVIKEASKK